MDRIPQSKWGNIEKCYRNKWHSTNLIMKYFYNYDSILIVCPSILYILIEKKSVKSQKCSSLLNLQLNYNISYQLRKKLNFFLNYLPFLNRLFKAILVLNNYKYKKTFQVRLFLIFYVKIQLFICSLSIKINKKTLTL